VISKNKIKLIRSLNTKKGRENTGLFVAEGPKLVHDLLNEGFIPDEIFDNIDDIKKVSFLQHPQSMLGVFKIRKGDNKPTIDLLSNSKLVLALDGVQDPGNLGTIIRIADWFGIEDILCSHDTVDCWNPKVVQATMGSIARIKLHYTDLIKMVDDLPSDYPVYATLLDGNNIYDQPLSHYGMIIMGNEGNGISPELRKRINRKLFIPNYPQERETAESLNVAIATSIVCAEFRRR
jgi:RNA methyltransferase, trmH family